MSWSRSILAIISLVVFASAGNDSIVESNTSNDTVTVTTAAPMDLADNETAIFGNDTNESVSVPKEEVAVNETTVAPAMADNGTSAEEAGAQAILGLVAITESEVVLASAENDSVAAENTTAAIPSAPENDTVAEENETAAVSATSETDAVVQENETAALLAPSDNDTVASNETVTTPAPEANETAAGGLEEVTRLFLASAPLGMDELNATGNDTVVQENETAVLIAPSENDTITSNETVPTPAPEANETAAGGLEEVTRLFLASAPAGIDELLATGNESNESTAAPMEDVASNETMSTDNETAIAPAEVSTENEIATGNQSNESAAAPMEDVATNETVPTDNETKDSPADEWLTAADAPAAELEVTRLFSKSKAFLGLQQIPLPVTGDGSNDSNLSAATPMEVAEENETAIEPESADAKSNDTALAETAVSAGNTTSEAVDSDKEAGEEDDVEADATTAESDVESEAADVEADVTGDLDGDVQEDATKVIDDAEASLKGDAVSDAVSDAADDLEKDFEGLFSKTQLEAQPTAHFGAFAVVGLTAGAALSLVGAAAFFHRVGRVPPGSHRLVELSDPMMVEPEE